MRLSFEEIVRAVDGSAVAGAAARGRERRLAASWKAWARTAVR